MKVTKRISEGLVIRILSGLVLLASGAVTRNAAAQALVFTQVPGGLTHISVGGDESVWGVDPAGNIYKWNKVTQNWVQSTGNLGANSGRIAVDRDGRPWVVRGDTGEIFQKLDGNPSTGNWQRMPGYATAIAAGADGSVWADAHSPGQSGRLSKWDPNQSTWVTHASGQATHAIAVDSGGNVYVGAVGSIWVGNSDPNNPNLSSYPPNAPSPPAGVTEISFGPFGAQVIGSDGRVYSYNWNDKQWEAVWTKSWATGIAGAQIGVAAGVWICDSQKTWTTAALPGWTQLVGLLSNISVGADGSVWGVNSQGIVYKWSPAIADWVQSSGNLGAKSGRIAVDTNGHPWVVRGDTGEIFRKGDGSPSGDWQKMPGLATNIAIGGDNSVWVSNAGGAVYKWDGSSNWIQAPASGVTRIAVTPQGVPWVINSSSQVWAKQDSDPKTGFIQIPGQATDVSVGPDGVVWVSGVGGTIYRYNGGGWDAVRNGSVTALAGDRHGLWFVDGANQIWRGTGLALHPASWMTDAFPLIWGRPLNKLIIPATHDSGTFGLISTADRLLQAPDDITAPDAQVFKALADLLGGMTLSWAQAQDENLYQQLSDGIRSLDLRPCVEKAGNIRICHGLYGPLMSDLLDDVRRFADEHPQEIILLQFSGFNAWPSQDMSASQHAQLRAMIHDKLGNHLLPEATPGNPWPFGFPANAPLYQYLPGGGRQGILVIYKDKDSIHNPEFWTDLPSSGASPIPPGEYYNSWIGTWDEGTKKQSLLDNLFTPADPNRRDQESVVLNDLSAQATPDGNAIAASLVPGAGYPSNLRDIADGTNPITLGWIKNEWAAQSVLNIVTADFYDRSCLVPLTYVLNGLTSDLPSGCQIGGSTSWSSWRAAKACPAGWTDTVFTCWKPVDYGRGAGYPWQFGDPLNSSGEFARCEADNGKGNCEQCLAIVYPKCKAGYHAVGCNICSADCPSNMTDTGATCEK